MTSVLSRKRPDENSKIRRVPSAGGPTGIALLPIGADLLPRQAVAGRGRRGHRFLAVGVVLIAILAVGALYLFSAYGKSLAEDRLATAQTQQQSLQVQQRGFADLVGTKQQAAALGAAITSVMSSDAPWSTLLAEVGKVHGGVTFTAVSATLVDPTAQAAATGTSTTPSNAIGTVSISGSAADKPTIAAFVDALSGLTGLADPFLSSVTAQQGSGATASGYTFAVTVDLTSDLQSTAKSRWATTTGGGK